MEKFIKAVRGMNDVLPTDSKKWRYIENILIQIAESYGYQQVRFPVVEQTALFARSVGEVTDIIEKEMYSFVDRSGENLSLRPEGTASCVRLGIEHGLLYNQTQKFWYCGPMYRHERPQKGRYREFYQFGAEAFGMPGPDIDAEILLLTANIFKKLNLMDAVKLQINSLGSAETRNKYKESLVTYFTRYYDLLDDDCKRRLTTNPLRILDSKNPALKDLISQAPNINTCFTDEDKKHFVMLCNILDAASIDYIINTQLVRGLDYYTRTVFEWVTDKLGAQGAVCAGGRFDNLVEQLGGKSTPAIGFSLGLERLLSLLIELQLLPPMDKYCDIYVIVDQNVKRAGLLLAEKLRLAFANLIIVTDCTSASFKNQFKKADKSGAAIAVIIGENELTRNSLQVKFLREEKEQIEINLCALIEFLQTEVL